VTEQQATPVTGEWASAHSPVIVGVDGSERNRAAISWAAHEAASVGADLRLVAVADDHGVRRFRRGATQAQAQRALDDALTLALEVVPTEHGYAEVVVGHPVDERLLEVADREHARLLAVGKRGQHAIPRMMVGSTALAVAGRADVPTAVVPDTWAPEGHEGRAVVVGVDPHRPQGRLLHLAFRRAHRLDVPLVAVHGREPIPDTAYFQDEPPVRPRRPTRTQSTPAPEPESGSAPEPAGGPGPEPAGAAGIEPTGTSGAAPHHRRPGDSQDTPELADAEAALAVRRETEALVDSWHRRFPEVPVEVVHSTAHPAVAVLDAAERGQLVLLGRHTSNRFAGFGFGSVTRAVLHYVTCPVMVVPTDED
jgi:nucleotide-binding universal stress UspA family protein